MPRKKTNLTMPVLALRGLMVFPHMVLHFDVGRPKSVAALQEAMMNDQKIFLVAQKDVDDPDPTPENLCTVGTIANIRQVMNLPGDSLRVLVEGETRGELTTVTQEDPFLLGRIHLPKVTAPADEMELAALVRTAKDYFDAYARASQRVSQETIASIRDVDDAEQIADLIAANILTKLEDRQQILEEFDIQRRLERLCTILSREIELTGVEKQVQERVKKQIDKNQKDYYLREHMKAIQTELGDTDATDVEELRERAKNTPLNDEARQRVDKELERLSRMTPGTPEVGMSRTYIEWILDLPWGKQTTDNLDLKRARKVLAQDHYGLEKVKERIVEYLAVLKLKQDMRGPILCFVGPPGVGKTSIVRAIAKAVGRQFVQVSLGGVRDEAEIRGHRRTYIGAIPGRIISGMKQAGTMNPVFLFDEIDKMSHDFRGDPASAMLEVLDGEQNGAFRDHYLELPFDLSRVMFITTANSIDTILHIGKDGIGDNLIKQADDALEARELIKGKVLENSMLSAREGAEELPDGFLDYLGSVCAAESVGSYIFAAGSQNTGWLYAIDTTTFQPVYVCDLGLTPLSDEVLDLAYSQADGALYALVRKGAEYQLLRVDLSGETAELALTVNRELIGDLERPYALACAPDGTLMLLVGIGRPEALALCAVDPDTGTVDRLDQLGLELEESVLSAVADQETGEVYFTYYREDWSHTETTPKVEPIG